MNKQIWLWLVLAMLSISFASAAITLTDTTTSKIFSGGGSQISFTMNDTGGGYGVGSVTSCNASLTSANTANTTDVWTVNTNASVTVNVNMTWVINITSLRYQDANDYVVKINCSNATASFYQGTLHSGATVDNTDPTEASGVSPSDGAIYTTNNTINFAATQTEANTIDVYVVWRDMSPTGHSKDLMTCTGASCVLEVTNVPRGEYYWAIQTSDRTDETNTVWKLLSERFGKMTGAAKATILGVTNESSEPGIPPIVIVAGVAVVLYLVYTSGKKKK